ncbi:MULTISPECIES: glycosyltransferase family 4 protein [Haloarcula]|uniref:Glycosyl transferase n=1 Tax=Haloarcula pellucida TaxID=1427151 RepID=A0A830GLQ2_9EURY|nr:MULTISPECIES: glycosyltransferase family 4 protein [Halomicroarcula]MBX0348705.1 glycosyltransferase family 4 protein [Halomicroarcula pellucida]MDS0278473.1 glycosyltransferase family 4 protein [Halomicroarcula sp. S1AR25-4]GGN92135.1 glycosyl transferase [Halomicroarcula pellucida]
MSTVRPLLLTARDAGGAGTATRRVHDALQTVGVDSRMLVRRKSTDDPTIVGPKGRSGKVLARLRPHLDSLPLSLYDPSPEFSLSWLPDRLDCRIAALDPDLLQLNWVAGGFMDTGAIDEFDRPLVWRLPDMWPLTGGCHYADGCTRYRDGCGNCPQLDSDHAIDPSSVTLGRKKRAVERADITVVATSSWLASCARESAIFEDCPVEIIPNALDTARFKPRDQSVARDLFGLPPDTPLVLFGSVGPLSNDRKGYDLLRDAIEQVSTRSDQAPELIVFGASEPVDPPDFGLPTHYTGYLDDEESLALLYAAADVMVVPSRYEGFGQTVTEAMACGTPVVAFDATGPSDTVLHEETGYLAAPYDPTDLARGIEWVLADPKRRETLGQAARNRAVEHYSLDVVGEQYRHLYSSLV